MPKKQDRQTVALPSHVVDAARDLSAHASKHGWAAFGVDRDDLPTITAIFDEAIKAFGARLKTKGGK